MTQEALKLALEALEMYLNMDTMDESYLLEIDFAPKAITALKEALAQEQEPVAYATKEYFHRELERRLKHIREEMKIKSVTMRCKDYDIALPIIDTDFGRVLVGQVSIPPQRKPLTLEQLREHWQVAKVLDMTDAEIDFADYVLITRDVEALHGIKE
jgi:hypothetical protein